MLGLFLAGITLLVASLVISFIGIRHEPFLTMVLSGILVGLAVIAFCIMLVMVA